METTNIAINGEPHSLKLTLGALAEIEKALGGDFDALSERLKSPRIGDVITILHALLIGGGHPLPASVLRAADIDFADAATAIAQVFEGFSPATTAPPEAPGKPRRSKAKRAKP